MVDFHAVKVEAFLHFDTFMQGIFLKVCFQTVHTWSSCQRALAY